MRRVIVTFLVVMRDTKYIKNKKTLNAALARLFKRILRRTSDCVSLPRMQRPSDVGELESLISQKQFAVLLFGAPFSAPYKQLKAQCEKRMDDFTDVVFVDCDAEDDDLTKPYDVGELPGLRFMAANGSLVKRLDGPEANEKIWSTLESRNNWLGAAASGGADAQHQKVMADYAKTVKAGQREKDDGGCCVSVDSKLMGYSAADLAKVAGAYYGLGCGNPLSFANLKPGETVVDLGSGAGIDVFLAASQVGPKGVSIGVDMTPEMIHKARGNAKEKGFANAFFRLGEIEHLPVGDNQADAVISNCVINLSPDKPQVIRDIFRVLKPGGRVAVSEVVQKGRELPEHLKTAEALSC